MQEALREQRARGGAGFHFLTPADRLAVAGRMLGGVLRAIRSASWHHTTRSRDRRLPAAAGTAQPIYQFDKAE